MRLKPATPFRFGGWIMLCAYGVSVFDDIFGLGIVVDGGRVASTELLVRMIAFFVLDIILRIEEE